MDGDLRHFIEEAIAKCKEAAQAGSSLMIRDVSSDVDVVICTATTAPEIKALGEAIEGGYSSGDESQ